MPEELPKRVLLVEDDPFIAMDLQESLISAGYDVVGPVGTVIEALALIKTEHLNGAVLDVNLDGEYSAPVAQALTDLKVPFIATTGYALTTLPMEFVHGDAIQKPYMSEILIGKLSKLLV